MAFIGAAVRDNEIFRRQFDGLKVVGISFDADDSGGFVDLEASPSIAALPSGSDFPINGWYLDDDAFPVFLLLFINSDNILSYLDFQRPDGTRILRWPPDPKDVRVQILDWIPNHYFLFDPIEGWTRHAGTDTSRT